MAFTPVNFDDGKIIELPMTAATYTKGQALTCTSGYYVTAAADQDGEVMAVCMDGIVIATTGDPAPCIITRGVKFLADCEDAPAQTDVGTFCDLAAATTLDPDSSTDDLFFIESIHGKVGTSTQVYGYFMHENPNS
jgi:hypothetical protein